MPKKDFYHKLVKEALKNDGWIVTHDPLYVAGGKWNFPIDMGAERLIIAEKGKEKIAVEVKSFIGLSTISEFHHAVGQFIFYLAALEESDPERLLFIAMPQDAYEELFSGNSFIEEKIVKRYSIHIFVYDTAKPAILSWIK